MRLRGVCVPSLILMALVGCTGKSGSGGGASSTTAPVQTKTTPTRPNPTKPAPSPGPTQPQPPATTTNHLVLSSGSTQIAADKVVNDPSLAADRAKFGITAFDQSYTLTTPAGTQVALTLTAFDPSATGTVSVRYDIAAAPGGTFGNGGGIAASPMLDFLGNLQPRAGNISIGSLWVETTGDGYAKVDFSGTISSSMILFVERQDSAGNLTHAVVSINVGAASAINPSSTPLSTYSGILSTTPILSSDNPIFGLPAMTGNGDRLTMVCYDSAAAGSVANGVPNCFGDFTRIERHLQLDPSTNTVTMGASPASGADTCNWRNLEIAGLYNVIAVAETGGDGLSLSFSFDRGGTFPQVLSFGSGRQTMLPRVYMGVDYTIGLVYWDSDQSSEQRLMLVEGKPDAYDVNNSPTSVPRSLRRRCSSTLDATSPSDAGTVALVPDIKDTTAGDLFVAYGFSSEDWTSNQEGFNTASLKTHIGLKARLYGTTTLTDTTVDDMTQVVPEDPSLAARRHGRDDSGLRRLRGRHGLRSTGTTPLWAS